MLIGIISIASISLGCRNCSQPFGGAPYGQPNCCNPGYANNGVYNPQYGQYAGANGGIVPPPATGTLNIPSVARNPFPYNNGYGSGLNTRGAAPTPATGVQNYNRSNGWRASQPGNPLGQNTGQPQNGSNAVSVLASSGSGSAVRPASATTSTGTFSNGSSGASNGTSYIDSPNYATTSINETNDRTRLPVTVASNVRAPSQFYQARSGSQNVGFNGTFVNQPYYVANNNFANNAQPRQPVGQPNPNGYVGSFRGQPVYQPQVAPTVLAQSTTIYDPYANGTRQADWRDRELGSESFR